MDNRTLYFGSNHAIGVAEIFPYHDLQGRELVEAYTTIVDASLQHYRSSLQFALIELIEFQDSGTRRSSSIVFSNLPESGVSAIVTNHYDIIRNLKQEPGMDWSLLAANTVQFGPTIFCCRQPHRASLESPAPLASQKRWSKPTTATLPSDYRITEEPDEGSVMAKLTAYAKRALSLLAGDGVLHVLVVPFSVLGPDGDGKKLGAACILIDALADLPDAALQDIYTKAQLFWLRYCSRPNGAAVELAAASQLGSI